MQADKYTIAWFKIAECVSRGEKERALGVYRLLSHSFNDDALASQLEADIYLSCKEKERAIGLYRRSFELYKKSKRLMEAAATAEHLVTLVPHDILVRQELIVLYHTLQLSSKAHTHIACLVEQYTHDSREKLLQEFLAMLQAIDEELYQYAVECIKR